MNADVRALIREAFYLNKLSMPQRGPEMTAYEVGQRVQEYIRNAMPIFEPMEAERNGQVCDLTFEIMFRNGAFGSPQDMPKSMSNKEIGFEFQSPLHDAIEAQKGQKFIEGQQMIAANAEEASSAAQAAGIQGAIGFGTQALNTLPLYFKDSTGKGLELGKMTGTNGPGANPAFQSKASDRFTNPTTMSTYQSQNPQPGTQYGVFGTNYGQTVPLQQGANAFQPSMFSSVGSDRKLKKNITKIGESPSGLNIYSFEYIDQGKFGEGVFQGVMSDEVPQIAVVKGSDGFDRVNYSLLDIEFKKI
jgi:hypothetical protein